MVDAGDITINVLSFIVLSLGIFLVYWTVTRMRAKAGALCADSSIMDIVLRTTVEDSVMSRAAGVATFASVAGAYVMSGDFDDVTGDNGASSLFINRFNRETADMLSGGIYNPSDDNYCRSLCEGYERLLKKMDYWPDVIIFRVLMFTNTDESLPTHAVIHSPININDDLGEYITNKLTPLFMSFEKAYAIEIVLGPGIRFEIPRQ